MNIHEYQAKELFKSYGINILEGSIAFSSEEAEEEAKKIKADKWVVKAQIHAGGRGKGGGVKIANSIDEVKSLSNKILGMQLVTHQTGPRGKKVLKVYIEEGCQIKKEFYTLVSKDVEFGLSQ